MTFVCRCAIKHLFIHSPGTLSGIDLVEVNPELGSREEQNLTLFTATELMAACFGKRRKGNLPLNYKLPFAKSFQKEKDRNVST